MGYSTPLASPRYHDGVRFDSRLEAAHADWHRIVWQYKPETFTLGGVTYEPDFWLPEIRTLLEIKGVFRNQRDYKALTFARAAARDGIMMVVGQSPAGSNFRIVHPTPQEVARGLTGQSCFDRGVFFGKCAECGRWQYVEANLDWDCRACGFYDKAGTYSDHFYPVG